MFNLCHDGRPAGPLGQEGEKGPIQDTAVFDHLGHAVGKGGVWQGVQGVRVHEHQLGLPEGPRQIFAVVQVNGLELKAERVEDLINVFFDIIRFSLTHLELEKGDTDLKRMLEQMCSEFGPVLAQRGMTCQLDLPGELRAVCDPGKMARVFDNLLNNACHYAYSDSVLRVAARTEEAQIVITFRNAGPTIPAEKLSRMFEQFFRLDASRGTHTGNAGLGLAIAKEIVEAHGGTITARSKEEEVLFTVTLPR